MPRFIGNTIPGATEIHGNARPDVTRIRLSYSQARLLPADRVYCSLDSTDTGGRGRRAKRWYRWFAAPATIAACKRATRKMIAKI